MTLPARINSTGGAADPTVLATLVPWACRCGATGAAATAENAAQDWLAHYNVDDEGTIAAADLRRALGSAATA